MVHSLALFSDTSKLVRYFLRQDLYQCFSPRAFFLFHMELSISLLHKDLGQSAMVLGTERLRTDSNCSSVPFCVPPPPDCLYKAQLPLAAGTTEGPTELWPHRCRPSWESQRSRSRINHDTKVDTLPSFLVSLTVSTACVD